MAAFPVDDVRQTEGANDRVQLASLGRENNRRIVPRWMEDGVTIIDPEPRGSTPTWGSPRT